VTGDVASAWHVELATLSDAGTERELNEDCCGSLLEGADRAVVAVADGVSGSEAGEVASRIAVDVTLRAFREEWPSLPAAQRLYRAVQQANIEVYDRAVAVPELRGMATTLTAAAVEGAILTVVHVGDSRLYLVRGSRMVQVTKDHTLAAERVRYGLLGRSQARTHPDRSVLTRSVGRELIVIRDRITRELEAGDLLLVCSDGLYNVLGDAEMARLVAGREAAAACRALVDAANERGTPDNVTAAVVRLLGTAPGPARPAGLGARLRRLLAGAGGRTPTGA
jgi:serine/threonine protein phosphatase PrpC